MKLFKTFCGFYENAEFRRLTCAHHDCHRRSQPQCAGTGNNQYGNCTVKSKFEAVPRYQPNDRGYYGYGDYNGYKYTAYFICQPRNGRFGISRVLDKLYNLGEGGFLTYSGCAKVKRTVFIYGGGYYRIPGIFLHRYAFSCNGGLIYQSVPRNDDAVRGNTVAGFYDNGIVLQHVFTWNGNGCAIPEYSGCFGRQIYQLFQCAAGFCFRTGFQIFP